MPDYPFATLNMWRHSAVSLYFSLSISCFLSQTSAAWCYFFFLFGACVNADPATDLTAFDDFGFFNNLDAFDATLFDVFSFLAIFQLSLLKHSLSEPTYLKTITMNDNNTIYGTK